MTLFRGLLAIILGLSLFFIPDMTRPMLGNFMGIFWITTGLVSLRNDPLIPHRGLARIAAVIIILAGLMMVSRRLVNHWVDWELIVNIAGAVIILTGVLHLFGGIQIGKQRQRGRTPMSMVLGLAEIVLGILFLFSSTGRNQAIYVVATIWALVGGTLIIADALMQRSAAKKHGTPVAQVAPATAGSELTRLSMLSQEVADTR